MYKPIKELGQNFLSDKDIVNQMITNLGIKDGEDIIEIGPGHGVITESIVETIQGKNNFFYAVELDKRFSEKLHNMYATILNVEVVSENILDFLPSYETNKPFRIIGSLPYYITSPIIHKIIKMKSLPESCVLLIQKEVAEKIFLTKPDSSYMSSFVQTFFEVEYLFDIPKEKFYPVPKVDGGVIKLSKRALDSNVSIDVGVDINKSIVQDGFVERFEGFLHRAYSNPRKMLNKVFTKEQLDIGSISSNLRAQNLDWKDWLDFYIKLSSQKQL